MDEEALVAEIKRLKDKLQQLEAELASAKEEAIFWRTELLKQQGRTKDKFPLLKLPVGHSKWID